MKKKLRKTGEIVDVIDWYEFTPNERDDSDYVSYIDSKGEEHPKEKLNINFDFEDVEEGLTKEIDWEERRYEIAKELFCKSWGKSLFYDDELAEKTVHAADALIAELKKGVK